jgi:hypothetical protein
MGHGGTKLPTLGEQNDGIVGMTRMIPFIIMVSNVLFSFLELVKYIHGLAKALGCRLAGGRCP